MPPDLSLVPSRLDEFAATADGLRADLAARTPHGALMTVWQGMTGSYTAAAAVRTAEVLSTQRLSLDTRLAHVPANARAMAGILRSADEQGARDILGSAGR